MARPRDLALGYAGGLLLAGLASWLRVAMTGSLGVDVYHPAFFVSSGLSGVGLGVASFCALRLLAAAGSVPRARIVRWALVANLVLVLAVPLTSTDLFTYLGLGRMQAQGANPFAVPMSATDMGPPPISSPGAGRTCPPSTARSRSDVPRCCFCGHARGVAALGGAVAVKLTMAACQVAFILLAARHVRRHRPGEDGARTLVLASFCPLLAWEVTGQAHNDGILCVALMLFVAAAVEGRALAAVLVLAAGTYVKMTLAPLLALYLLFLLRTRGARACSTRSRRRRWARCSWSPSFAASAPARWPRRSRPSRLRTRSATSSTTCSPRSARPSRGGPSRRPSPCAWSCPRSRSATPSARGPCPGCSTGP